MAAGKASLRCSSGFDHAQPITYRSKTTGIAGDMTFKKMDKVNCDAVLPTNLDSLFNMSTPRAGLRPARLAGRADHKRSALRQAKAVHWTAFVRAQPPAGVK